MTDDKWAAWYADMRSRIQSQRLEPTREERIDFAYGNTRLSNPDVTREMCERAVDEIDAAMARKEVADALDPS